MNNRSDEQTLWTSDANNNQELDDQFAEDVLKRVRARVTLQDYLFMFLHGFFNVCIGLLKGLPKSKPPESQMERKVS